MEQGFYFVLHIGSHTHIFKTKIFNQNTTFKSIELLDRSKKILADSCELWGIPVTISYYCISKVIPIRFFSCPEVSSDSLLFKASKQIELELASSEMTFGIQVS